MYFINPIIRKSISLHVVKTGKKNINKGRMNDKKCNIFLGHYKQNDTKVFQLCTKNINNNYNTDKTGVQL